MQLGSNDLRARLPDGFEVRKLRDRDKMLDVRAATATILALLVCTEGCCSKPKSSSSGPTPAPTPTPAPPPKREIPMLAGNDDPPDHWTTAAQSQRAAPSFAQRDGYAPQLDEAAKQSLYNGAEAASRAADGGPDPCLVVCYVLTLRSEDTGFFKGLFNSAANDVDLHVKRDRDKLIVERGASDQNWVYVSVPLVDCNDRKPWELRALDRDGTGFDTVGVVRLVPRFPLKAKSNSLSVSCRSIERGTVENELSKSFVTTDQELTDIVDELAIDPREPTLGVAPQLSRMQRAVSQPAAWVGWSDPRVIRRRDRGLRILEALLDDRREFVKKKVEEGNRHASFRYGRAELDTELVSLSCDDAHVARYAAREDERTKKVIRMACVVELSTRNQGPDDLSSDLGGTLGWRMVVVRGDGETAPVSFLAFEGSEVTKAETGVDVIAAGAKGNVVLGIPEEAFADGGSPVLLMMNPFMSDGPVFLTLPAGERPSRRDAGRSG